MSVFLSASFMWKLKRGITFQGSPSAIMFWLLCTYQSLKLFCHSLKEQNMLIEWIVSRVSLGFPGSLAKIGHQRYISAQHLSSDGGGG